MKFKVIIAGSRDFNNYDLLKEKHDFALRNKANGNVEIVSGTARGADRLGERYASEKGIRVKQFPAQWERYGKRAGYLRNKEMAEYADALIAFWDGKSLGTKMMIDLAERNGLKRIVITYKEMR